MLVELASVSHEKRLEFISALCFAVDFSGKAPGTSPVPGMPYELLEQIALPTLLAQRLAQPDDPYVHVWLAMLPSRRLIPELPESRELLEAAHQLAPNDTFIAERLADERLNSIWFSCHHLPEILLSSEHGVREDIAHVRRLLHLLPLKRGDALAKQIDMYEQQVNEFARTNRDKNEA